MTHVVLLAHGSPDTRSGDAVRTAAAALSTRLARTVTAAFLEHDSPDLGVAVAGRVGPIAVLPLLLSAAYHARVDVPAAIANLDRDVTLLRPLGHPTTVLEELLRHAGGPAVVVAAGTKVDEERTLFAEAVAVAAYRARVPATAAFATGPGKRIADATSNGGATIVPWILAPGRLLDSVHEAAQTHGCPVIGEGLLVEPTLLDEIARQLA